MSRSWEVVGVDLIRTLYSLIFTGTAEVRLVGVVHPVRIQ